MSEPTLGSVLDAWIPDDPQRIVLATVTATNTVQLAGESVAIALPALATVVAGQTAAVLVSEGSRLILGPVGDGTSTITGDLDINAGTNEAVAIYPTGTAPRPYYAVYGGADGSRAGYWGFTDESTDEVRIATDKGDLVLWVEGGEAMRFALVSGNRRVSALGVHDTTSSLTTNMVRVNDAGLLMRSTSSLTVKNVDGPLADAPAKLMALEPIEFSSLIEHEAGARCIGFGAEQVAAVDDRLARIDEPDGETPLASLDPVGILAVAVATIQDQQARIEALEQAVADLQAHHTGGTE